MNQSISENAVVNPVGAEAPLPLPNSQSLDRSLVELRSGRRLEKVTASVESFLLSQVSRLDKSLEQCKLATDQNQIAQRVFVEFERQREAWEKDRQAEIQRLSEASEKLILGWKQLEEERQKWISQRHQGRS